MVLWSTQMHPLWLFGCVIFICVRVHKCINMFQEIGRHWCNKIIPTCPLICAIKGNLAQIVYTFLSKAPSYCKKMTSILKSFMASWICWGNHSWPINIVYLSLYVETSKRYHKDIPTAFRHFGSNFRKIWNIMVELDGAHWREVSQSLQILWLRLEKLYKERKKVFERSFWFFSK